MFHDGSRRLQDRFDTRRIADRIEDLLVEDSISDSDRESIERADMFFPPSRHVLPAEPSGSYSRTVMFLPPSHTLNWQYDGMVVR